MSAKDIKAGGAYVELLLKDEGFVQRLGKAKDMLFTFAAGVVSVRGVVDGAKAAFNALKAPLEQFIEAGNALDKMSKSTGASVEQLSKLKYAADQSEVSIDAVESALLHMQSRRIDPSQFEELAQNVAAIEDPLLRVQAANRAFGSSGQALLPMIDDLDALEAKAESLGLVMGGPTAASAARLRDMFATLWDTLSAGTQAVGQAVAPFLEVALPAVQAFATMSLTTIQDASERIGATVGSVATFISNAWQAVYDFTAPIIGAYKAAIVSEFHFIQDVAQTVWNSIGGVISAVWGDVAATTGGVMAWLQDTIIGTLSSISFAFDNWKTLINTALTSAELAVVRFANQTVYFFTEAIPGYLKWFGDNWREVFTDIANITKTVATNIWENLSNLWDAIAGLLSGEGFNFEWTPLTKGFESAIKELPKIAEREMGPLEKSLQNELNALAGELVVEWDKHRVEFGRKAKEFTPKNLLGDALNKAAVDAQDKAGRLAMATPNSTLMQDRAAGAFSAAALVAMGGAGEDPQTRAIKKAADEQKARDERMIAAVKERKGLGP